MAGEDAVHLINASQSVNSVMDIVCKAGIT